MKRRDGLARTVLATIALLLGLICVVGGSPADAAASCDATGPTAPMTEVPGSFHGIAPQRVADSRSVLVVSKLAPRCAVGVEMKAANGVPAQARAVSLNVTTVNADQPGYLIVYPCGTPVPSTSNINSQVGAAVPNLVVVSLPESRRICFVADHNTDLIVDVTGWFGSAGGGFVLGGTTAGTQSARLLDTRTGPRPSGTGRWPGATELPLQVGPTDGTWLAVSANVTVTDPAEAGFVSVYPCGQAVPVTSTVNVLKAGTRANQTLVALDNTGRLCLWSSGPTHLIVDIVGRFVSGAGVPLALSAAQRIVDSRSSVGGWTSPFTAGTKRSVDPSGGVAPTTGIALLNVVATRVTEAGFLTFYPCGGAVPTTSSLNFAPGRLDVSNLVTVDANTCVTGTGGADVVIDRLGWFGRPGGLTGLSAGQPGQLQPEFEPDGHDYSVPCAVGTLGLPVLLDAAPGRTLVVDGVSRGASFAGTVPVVPGGLIKVDVTATNGPSESYAIRCLPADFPPFDATVPGSPAPGWYLTTLGYGTPNVAVYATIFDEHGAVVWYRRVGVPIVDLKRLANGNLAWVSLAGIAPFGTDPVKGYEEHTLDGSLVATYHAVGSPTDHHDFRQLPNGHVLVVSYLPRTGVNTAVLGAGYFTSDRVVDAVIQELDPTLPAGSAPVWEWNSKDHFNINETTFPQRFDTDGNGTLDTVDLVHLNSIEPQANGDIVISLRHLDAVVRIDRATGNVIWKVGGSATTKDSAVGAKILTVVNDPLGGPARQHSATITPTGNLLVYDNRTPFTEPGSPSIGPARAAEYQLDLIANTARLVWHLDQATGRSAFGLGSVRRLTDGDTLVHWGAIQPLMIQVDAASNLQWQIFQPTGGYGYRVALEPVASFDRATLRALSG